MRYGILFALLTVLLFTTSVSAQEEKNWERMDVVNIKSDLGYSHPAFFKYSSNDVYDVILGHDTGELIYQPNIGNPGELIFDSYEFGLFTRPLTRSAPSITDFNDDGLGDLVVGLGNGSLVALLQQNSGNFQFNNSLVSDVSVTSFAKPVFTDLNKDGVKDLVVGSGEGKLEAFLNRGTWDNPIWEKQENLFDFPLDRHPVPFPLDPDGDGLDDFIVGSERFGIVYIKNTGFEGGRPQYVLIDSTNPGNPFLELSLRNIENIAPTLVDFNGDGKLDIAYGAKDGSVVIFQNLSIDFAEVDLQSVVNLGDVIIIVAIVVIGIIVVAYLYFSRREKGTPQFILIGTDTGISPFSYSFNEFSINEIDLAGGAFAGINSIISEITNSELNLLEAGDSKIIIVKSLLPNAGVTLMTLVWSTANDKEIRELAEKLSIYVVKNFEEVFISGLVTDTFITKVETMVEFLFSKYI